MVLRSENEILAEKSSKRLVTAYSAWEYGRIQNLLGVVRALSLNCFVKGTGICNCHDEYTLLRNEVKVLTCFLIES